ncbi:nucleotidyltransferase family protein [Emticicia sp. C21]|uniref:nucleotidyltransferase domain-containing protein n=1 Tax=Emticicia sp. C21 TaxID=2302915 RepID=UPI000E344773|nr:nucleotidyltransferase family protein [Emticicia sp. C21]RFS18303.1 hypothetical protein D0T08_03375 [Emticicia sp. C21]
MLSVELQFLIECCKISLLQAPVTKLLDIIENHKVNWEKLYKMLAYHSIRPTVYSALKGITSEKINADFFSLLNQEVKIKSAHSLFMSAELTRIQKLFSEHQIPFIPYKGLTWSKILYKKSFREGADMDFLIDRNKVFEALHLLKKDGYELGHLSEYTKKYTPEDLLKALIETERVEMPLVKENAFKYIFKFDFHWELVMKPFSYGFATSELFTDKFDEQERMLLIIILHNGKKEAWTKLKYISDLLCFVDQYGQDFNWDLFLEKLNNYSIEKSLFKGLALINFFVPIADLTTFNRAIPEYDALNISFWEEAIPYEISKKARINFFRLKFSYHKNIKESYYCITNFMRYLSYPNPSGNRLIVFPASYKLLNLSSSLLSYLYFNTFNRKN